MRCLLRRFAHSHVHTAGANPASAVRLSPGPLGESQRAMNYDSFLSRSALRRQPSAIRRLQPFLKDPEVISLGGGMPDPQLFPIVDMTFTLADGSAVQLGPANTRAALQYSSSYGMPLLLQQLTALQCRSHKRAAHDQWSIVVTTGSQDALAKAFGALLNEGDTLFTDAPTYSGSLGCLRGMGVTSHGIPCDAEGMQTHALERRLREWPSTVPRPRVVYIVPTGQNPGGTTLSTQRRKHLLQLAEEFDLLILEDDPYFYLYYGHLDDATAPDQPQPQPPSLFSLDTCGNRVIRFDSFSKVVSSGVRIGWATGPTAIVERMQLDQQVTCLHTSGVSQALVSALLTHWGEDGFDAHVTRIRHAYRDKRNHMEAALRRHFAPLRVHVGGDGEDGAEGVADACVDARPQATWTSPSAGMFIWLRFGHHVDTQRLVDDAVRAKVLAVPGVSFYPSSGDCGGDVSSHCRLSFSTCSPQQMETAVGRLAQVVAEYTLKA